MSVEEQPGDVYRLSNLFPDRLILPLYDKDREKDPTLAFNKIKYNSELLNNYKNISKGAKPRPEDKGILEKYMGANYMDKLTPEQREEMLKKPQTPQSTSTATASTRSSAPPPKRSWFSRLFGTKTNPEYTECMNKCKASCRSQHPVTGGKTQRRKTQKRKMHRRKTHKRKTQKRKMHRRKTHRRKTHRRKTQK